MAYDEVLAERIRDVLAPEPDVTEKKMFGGLAFLVGGAMAVAAVQDGALMVRADPGDAEAHLARPGVRPMEMRGRELAGWLLVDADALRSEPSLEAWVAVGTAAARSAPATPARRRR